MDEQNKFSFNISLSVLDHLGRNLYRSFATVLGEAISNSWDADSENVWIIIDRDKNNFLIKDDGVGMTADDFQNKFLKIGYSKRKDGITASSKNRPYIGRKGIGKLALLSCADKITVISKTDGQEYIGGVIDNSGLDQAITGDLNPKEYELGNWNADLFKDFIEGHDHGTIIYFDGIKDGIKSSLEFLRKTVALYFRFSLLDSSFKIFMDGSEITPDCLSNLIENTEFLWKINNQTDPFVEQIESGFNPEHNENKTLIIPGIISGFVASVKKPRDLKVLTTNERVGIDLFVNGRLRERDILKHIPTARIAENYLYGQIHFNELDDNVDRFTSSRESIVADDPKFKALLDNLSEKVINPILIDWDNWRRKHKKDGDPENESIPKKERRAEELFNVISEEYQLPEEVGSKKEIDKWIDSLSNDAKYNFVSYGECFISENLIRRYIQENKISVTKEADAEIKKWQNTELINKGKGNISIDIRKNNTNLGYLSMDFLAAMVDKKDPIKEACLLRDAYEYKPVRDALAHTSLLTDVAKQKLNSVYENIKGRIRSLLSSTPTKNNP